MRSTSLLHRALVILLHTSPGRLFIARPPLIVRSIARDRLSAAVEMHPAVLETDPLVLVGSVAFMQYVVEPTAPCAASNGQDHYAILARMRCEDRSTEIRLLVVR